MMVEAYKLRMSLMKELTGIKSWLKEHDYMAVKIIVGEWTVDNPKFLAYKIERAEKVARLNELLEFFGIES